MTKIKNTDAYPLVSNPSLLDYLAGSRFLLDGKTENFQISSIIKLFNSANGISNVEFQFSDGSDSEIDPTTSGWFFTNNNQTALDSFTHLIFNKEALGQLDLSVLFNKIDTLENVILKLRSPEDPENFFTLKIISIENETDYFSIEVINSNDFSLGELLNNRIYGLYFDISSDDLKLDKADYTGNATDLDNRIEVLENLQDLDTNFTGRAYAIWTGVGFVYEAVYPAYYIQGVLYPAGTQLITLNTSDATNPRQDVIAVNATGAIKVTGTPAVNPLVPTVDLATNIIITTILVPENATVPPGAVNENIYLDNAEWTGTSSGVSADFDYTNNIFSGTKCINLPSFAVSNYIDLTKTGNINIQNYRELTFRIRLGSTFSTSSNITFRFGFGGISQSAAVSLIHGRYGFNRTIIGSYQHIIIPLTAFTFTASDFNKLTISKSVGTTSSFILDSIILTSNATGGTTNVLQNTITSIITDNGISNATRDNDSIRLASQNDGLIITSYINKEIRFTSLFTSGLKTLYDIAYSWISTNGGNVISHLGRTDNPHVVTKSQVGLGNVDNTSDINKPVSTAQATADGVVLSTANAYTDSRVSSVYVYKGNVANYASLPSSGQTIGWVWNLLDTGANYAWTGTVWDELGTTIDISGKENTSNKTATVIGNESSTSLYLNILGAVTYFQQKLTDSIFGAFIVGLTAKATPIDADSVSIIDSADSNKAKKTTFTQLKNWLFNSPTFTGSVQVPNGSLSTEAVNKGQLDAASSLGALVTLYESNGIGYVINGRNPANFGNIGLNAIDLSTSTGASSTRGATGSRSFVVGQNSIGSGIDSYTNGNNNNNSAQQGFVYGNDNTNSGLNGFLFGNSLTNTAIRVFLQGIGHTTPSFAEIVMGEFSSHVTPSSTTTWVGTDRAFTVGNGTIATARSNALVILKNGLATLPSVTNALIEADATGKAIVTKEYVNNTIKTYKTYFINTATGNNATGVYEDASKPFASIDYVNANFTIQDGDIFYLQGTGQTYAINNQLQAKKQSFISDDNSTNILDFSGNSNQYIIATTANVCNIKINLPSGTLRCERNGGTGVIFQNYGNGAVLYSLTKEIYWNTSTYMTFGGGSFGYVRVLSKITCRVPLCQTINEDVFIPHFVCLANGASYTTGPDGVNFAPITIKINRISGAGSYTFNLNNNYIVGDILTTEVCSSHNSIEQIVSNIHFNNSIITGGGFVIPSHASLLIISGNIRSVTSFTNNDLASGSLRFLNFTVDLGTNKINTANGVTISFENCSIKSTNSPLGVVTPTGTGNFIIKNSTFEVVNAVPLMTGGAGGTRTLTVAGLSTNATMLSDQSGTGVTVTQFTNY